MFLDHQKNPQALLVSSMNDLKKVRAWLFFLWEELTHFMLNYMHVQGSSAAIRDQKKTDCLSSTTLPVYTQNITPGRCSQLAFPAAWSLPWTGQASSFPRVTTQKSTVFWLKWWDSSVWSLRSPFPTKSRSVVLQA